MTLVMTVAGGLTFVLLASTRPAISDSRGVETAAVARQASSSRPPHRSPIGARRAPATAAAPPMTCRLFADPHGYVNPLAAAVVVPKRIDQGVDYAGSGTLTAIGTARITYLAAADTGWPGAFIEYRLLTGADRGCYVYYAEGVTPAPGLRVSETVPAGRAVARIVPGSTSGIEIGWAAGDGTKSYASDHGQWSSAHEADNIPSAAGLYFSELIAALGGPPGRIEG